MSVAEIIAQKKEALHNKTMLLADEFKNEIPKNFIYRLEDILIDFVTDASSQIYQVEEEKADRSEIRLLIEKMEIRFEQMDKRFEQMDKRFENMQVQMDKRFEDMQVRMDKRFEDMQIQTDKRFESIQIQMDRRFADMNKRFNFIQWLIGFGFLFLGTLMSVFQFVGK